MPTGQRGQARNFRVTPIPLSPAYVCELNAYREAWEKDRQEDRLVADHLLSRGPAGPIAVMAAERRGLPVSWTTEVSEAFVPSRGFREPL